MYTFVLISEASPNLIKKENIIRPTGDKRPLLYWAKDIKAFYHLQSLNTKGAKEQLYFHFC